MCQLESGQHWLSGWSQMELLAMLGSLRCPVCSASPGLAPVWEPGGSVAFPAGARQRLTELVALEPWYSHQPGQLQGKQERKVLQAGFGLQTYPLSAQPPTPHLGKWNQVMGMTRSKCSARSPETSIPSGRKMDDLGSTSGAPPPPWLELASVMCPYLEPLQAALIPSPGSPICGRGPAEPHGLQSLVLPAVRIAQASSTGTVGQFIPSVFPSHSRAVETTEAPGCWRTKQVLKHRLLAEPDAVEHSATVAEQLKSNLPPALSRCRTPPSTTGPISYTG
ncbi:hypothetical protein J1605_004627 [Eschrichtius robustus]|uniref:Uncharacterized protein n=1 Tax=Eschrichtius robustus TaxID=9764 RepID=A0AB34HGY8_ESCRO|nr:hypothetical protein J1605_004627 [Eschrichtius robustus]